MPQPIAYLAFDGRCADAMRFYAKVLGGRLQMMSNAQSPFAAQTPKEHLQRIMHARLILDDGGTLYAGDCPPDAKFQGIHGVSVTLNYDSVSQAEQVFAALADGGQIVMPMNEAFWAKRFGMLIDKFGCPWIVNGSLLELQLQS